MSSTQIFLKKHSSTILTVIGSAGVVATTILAVKATPKAIQLIEDEKNRQNNDILTNAMANGYETCKYVRELKPLEVIKVAWKPYIPTTITGLSTIACILRS